MSIMTWFHFFVGVFVAVFLFSVMSWLEYEVEKSRKNNRESKKHLWW